MKFSKKIGLLTLLIFMFTMSLSVVLGAPQNEPIRVMCYGDSNTWGWIPVENGFPSTRYGSDVRWTGVLQKDLGNKFKVIEEGLNGRTAGVDDYANGLDISITADLNLNGRPTLLPVLKTQMPVDVLVIMLGTNDVKPYLKQTPEKISESIKILVNMAKKCNANKETEWLAYKAPKILVVSPAPVKKGVSEGMNEMFKGGDITSKQLASLYAKVAQEEGVDFFDASSIITVADGIDGVHLSAESHNKLGKALAQKIKEMTKN